MCGIFVKTYRISVMKLFLTSRRKPPRPHPAHRQFEYNTAKAPPTGASRKRKSPARFITHLNNFLSYHWSYFEAGTMSVAAELLQRILQRCVVT